MKIATARGIVVAIAAAGMVALLVPPAKQVRAQYVDEGTWGRTSSGSANAQSITIANYDADEPGVTLRFIPGFTNTGPATISINGHSPIALQRPSSIGLVAFSGQELWAGEPTAIMFMGSVYKLVDNIDMTPIGQPVEFRGSAAPRGTLIEDGSCVSETTYPALFSVIGSTYNALAPVACTGSTFALPDSGGAAFTAFDAQGAHGAAGRITTASCATPNAVGICGNETQTLTRAQLPTGITSSGTVTVSGTYQEPFVNGALAGGGGTGFNTIGIQALALTSTGTNTFTSNNTSGAAHPILPPSSFGIRAIKY
jgi:microcystin-dependent protein